MLNLLIRDFPPHSSDTPLVRRSESSLHSQAGHCRWDNLTPTSAPWSRPIHPRPQCSQWRSFSHPGAAAPRSRYPCWNGRLLHRTSCLCPFCLTAPLQLWLLLYGSSDKVLDTQPSGRSLHLAFRRKQKIRTPLLSEKSSDFVVVVHLQGLEPWAHWLRETQRATIVNFQNYADSLFLSLYRKFAFCICCILCTYYSLLHPLSSRSGVQKVCKNVQSQNQPLKTGIGFLCKAGKTVGFEPDTAATILPVQAKHQMYINNHDSWQGFGQLNRHRLII